MDPIELPAAQTFDGPRRWATPWTELSALLVGVTCSLPLFAWNPVVATVFALCTFGITLRLHPGRRDRTVRVGADGFEEDDTFVSWSRVSSFQHRQESVEIVVDGRRRVLNVHDPAGLHRALVDAHEFHAAKPPSVPSGDYRTALKSKAALVRVVTTSPDLEERERAFVQLDGEARDEVIAALADSRTRRHFES